MASNGKAEDEKNCSSSCCVFHQGWIAKDVEMSGRKGMESDAAVTSDEGVWMQQKRCSSSIIPLAKQKQEFL
jgi:hypothetical protein